tara:strand:- start:78 stop:572 length:495 start_codon:yes stop_codon:yes gene_type:complete
MLKKILLLSLLTLLTNCASNTHNGSSWIVSTSGSSMGAVTAGGVCAGVVDDPMTIAACASIGAIHGADQIWNDDFNTHKHYFVDHLIGAPNKPNITNWYNPATKNSGIIKTTRTWYQGPLKCRDYESTINITPSWPVAYFSSGPIRKTDWGVACIMPDGRVVIK